MQSNNAAYSLSPLTAFVATAIVTCLWLAALLEIPSVHQSGLALIIARVVAHLVVLRGAWAALSLMALSDSERRTTWLLIAIPLTLWQGAAWAIVVKGLLLPGATPVPLLPFMVVVPTAIVMILLLRSHRIGLLLDVMPSHWLIGLQVLRVLGGVFLVNWLLGIAPAPFAVPAGTGDVLTGLMALPTAIALASGRPGAIRAAVVWNLFGIADLVIALTMGALTSPGGLQRLAFDHPGFTVGAYPTAIIPAFTVPNALVLHALSLRQLWRRTRPVDAVAA